ncbi:hypothetical protein BamMEX5DRAFT_6792 [Burkholderia ambifaria MEX-5]|uniref:Uncharacterized protein n=1 Tax=Burkholderia ambifaria MEX-5 TaxID=396597 RepID=B1TG76_9BURK|nr:hypothetical protein BamMEX5DRAFT_6792 [Burkholderia ambifaria MEX-5]
MEGEAVIRVYGQGQRVIRFREGAGVADLDAVRPEIGRGGNREVLEHQQAVEQAVAGGQFAP